MISNHEEAGCLAVSGNLCYNGEHYDVDAQFQ